MSSKYILVQKNNLLFVTKEGVKNFPFSNLLEESNTPPLFSNFDFLQNNLPHIIQNFIKKIELDKKDNLILLLDYPWVKTTILDMPWTRKTKLKKILPFALQKKTWEKESLLQNAFYFLKDKENKKNRAVVYSIDQKTIKLINALFESLDLTLKSIECYTHWLEQEVISFQKKRPESCNVTFSSFYANLFIYDKIGLQANYNIPLQNQKKENFWKSFLSLWKRINIIQAKPLKLFFQDKKKYTSYDLEKNKNNFSFVKMDNSITYSRLYNLELYLRTQGVPLNLNQKELKWKLSHWKANIQLIQSKIYFFNFLPKNSFFSKNLQKVKTSFVLGLFFFLISALFFLEYQRLEIEKKNYSNLYQFYIQSYLLSNTPPQSIKTNLESRLQELENLSQKQKKFLQKDYSYSKLLLNITEVRKNIAAFKVNQLSIEGENINLEGEWDPKSNIEIQKKLASLFLITTFRIKDIKNQTYNIEMKKK